MESAKPILEAHKGEQYGEVFNHDEEPRLGIGGTMNLGRYYGISGNILVYDDETVVCPHCQIEYEQGELHLCPDTQESEGEHDFDFERS